MSESVDFPYDAFISYSPADQRWVRDCLLPRLETAGLRVCIDFRDFDVGVPDLINKERAIDSSRHTLLILTSAWVESEWGEFESLLTQTKDPGARQRKLLPVLLETCHPPERITMLSYADFRSQEEQEAQLERVIAAIRDDLRLEEIGPSLDRIAELQSVYREYLQRITSELREWETRYTPMFAKFEKLTLFAQMKSAEDAPEPLLNLIGQNQRIVVLGVAGAGKTTTVRRVALDSAAKAFEEADSPIPILVSLRDYDPPSIEALIAAEFGRWGLAFGDIKVDLQTGRFLLIFDGLNEVAESKREHCYRELRHFVKMYPDNRYIFTSRPQGYRSDCLTIDQMSPPACSILPLTREQIEYFISCFFDHREESTLRLVEELRLHDEAAWKNPASLVHLAAVPLMLQMLILTFEELHRIPRNEGDLLLRFVDHVLLEREPGKTAGNYSADVKKQLLAAVAFEMQKNGLVAGAPKRLALQAFTTRLQELQESLLVSPSDISSDIWEEIQNNHLLLVEDTRVSWPHPLFQELFAGLELRGLCFDAIWAPSLEEISYRFSPLRAKWFGDSWFDTGIIMLGVVPDQFRVQALVAVSSCNPNLAWQAYLRLEPEHDPALAQDYIVGLREAALSQAYEGTQHRMLIEAISRFTDIHLVCNHLQDIVCQCPTWQGRHEALHKVWAKCRMHADKDVTDLLLTVSETDPSQRVRIAALGFLVRTKNNELIPFLTERLLSDETTVASRLHQQMGEIRRHPVVLGKLRHVATSKGVETTRRRRAIWALGASDTTDKSVREVIRRLAVKEQSTELRREAVEALRHFPSRAVVNTLRKTVHDGDKLVRLKSIDTLNACARYNTASVLISALADSDSDVGEAAIEAIVAIGGRRGTLGALKEAARSYEATVRRRAITAIARLAATGNDHTAIEATKALQSHTSERDRTALLEVAWGLSEYDPQTSTRLFKDLLEDESETVRELTRQRCEELGVLF